MAVFKQGTTIAGVGEKYFSKNLISPQFDAKIRQFIIGLDCIIDGLNMPQTGNTLSAGTCFAKGYVGELKNQITITGSYNYVYGVFKVKFGNGVDEFYIETSTTEITTKEDILHEAGVYYLLLYKKEGLVNKLQLLSKNPQFAVQAQTTEQVTGTLGKGVTAVTPETNNNSKLVATTEFVQKQIEADINFEETEIKGNNLTFKLKRKAKYVTGTVSTDYTSSTPPSFSLSNLLPEGFRPKDRIKFVFFYGYNVSSSTNLAPLNAYVCIFNKDGTVEVIVASRTNEYYVWDSFPVSFGYETN